MGSHSEALPESGLLFALGTNGVAAQAQPPPYYGESAPILHQLIEEFYRWPTAEAWLSLHTATVVTRTAEAIRVNPA